MLAPREGSTEDTERSRIAPGKHNKLEAAVVEEFAPRFAPGAFLLYLGDAAKKEFYLYREMLTKLNIPVDGPSCRDSLGD